MSPAEGELSERLIEAIVDDAVPAQLLVIALILRVETPCTYISVKAETNAFSLPCIRDRYTTTSFGRR